VVYVVLITLLVNRLDTRRLLWIESELLGERKNIAYKVPVSREHQTTARYIEKADLICRVPDIDDAQPVETDPPVHQQPSYIAAVAVLSAKADESRSEF
jgi:hypothetical protein